MTFKASSTMCSFYFLLFALAFSPLCAQFYQQLCFLSRIFCLFQSSTFILSNRKLCKETKARNRKQTTYCRWIL